MSKKKPQKGNGFFLFMKEMQEELRRRGKTVPMRDMPNLAGPKWAQLSDAKKQAYQVAARRERGGEPMDGATAFKPPLNPVKGAPRPGIMDSTGMLLSERRDHAAEMAERRSKEKEKFKASLPAGNLVAKELFYFIDFQSLCEVTIKGETQYLPCEVGLVEFSLISGIKRKLHKFVDPGKIPIGYRYLAQSTSDSTHQIPISGFDQAERDYRKFLGDIEHFLDPSWTEVMPPVFSKREYAEKCEWCLSWLADKAGVLNRLTKVYEVEALLCVLSGHLDGKPISPFQAEEMLKTSVYDYEAGTRCDFHEEKETKYCSLGVCNIYAFVTSETLCPTYGVSLTSSHLPKFTLEGVVANRKRKVPSEEVARDLEDDDYLESGDSEDEPTPLYLMGRGRGLARDFANLRGVGGTQNR